MGANSLTPKCPADEAIVCKNLTNYMPQFDVAAARLNGQNSGLALNSSDIFTLMRKILSPFAHHNSTLSKIIRNGSV